jgi:hypothetical protein
MAFERSLEIWVNRNYPAASLFCGTRRQLDPTADLSVRIEYHGPGKGRDFAGPETRLYAQHNNYPVSVGVAPMANSGQHSTHVARAENLCRFPSHDVSFDMRILGVKAGWRAAYWLKTSFAISDYILAQKIAICQTFSISYVVF